MAFEGYSTDSAAVQAQGGYQQFYDAFGNNNDTQQQQRHQQSYISGTATSSSDGGGEESMLEMGGFGEMDMREYGGMTMESLGASMPGMHPVRVSIPQYMSSTPMLAPGGGAEVLPAGLLNSSMAPPPGVSWYTNSGFIGSMQEYSTISINPHNRQESQSQSSQTPSQTTQSPFDYDAYPSSSTPVTASSSTVAGTPSTRAASTVADSESSPPSSVRSPPSPRSSASKALNLHILNGSINPAQPITASQLSAIGISSTANTSPHAGLNAPSSLGLPVYSASGFDLLSVMARVATRPDPKVVLGPVDLTSSFVVVDVRRHDCPVIYVSPTFCRLTGYDESDVIGRNCRFLQSPNGQQSRGEVRQYTSHEAVKHLKKNLVDNKECQTSIINYKKNGDAFINLVTVIPIRGGELGASGDEDKVVYHVGFQVDLTEQPNAILQKLKDGTYIVNYTANNPVAIAPLNPLNRLFQQQQHRGLGGIGAGSTAVGLGFGGAGGGGYGGGMAGAMGYGGLHAISAKDRKLHAIGQPVVSQELRKLLDEPEFLKSFPVATGANADAGAASTTTTTTANSGTVDNEDPAESGSRSGTPPPPNSNTGRDSPQPNPQNNSSSITISSSNTTVPHASSMNHPLSLILLEYTPDFLHVVSLKGDFLYVAPAVRRVLGYESHELVGQSLVDICHPSDRVPLVRELKESSSSVAAGAGGADDSGGSKDKDAPDDIQSPTNASDPHTLMALHRPRTVDLLFRALTKSGRYVWVECRGRLHVEPGKGRKAILLSGRAKEMAGLRWEVVKGASGGVRGVINGVGTGAGKDKNKEKEGKDGLGKESNGTKKRKKAGSGGGDEERTDPVHLNTEEVDVKSEFWGTITRNGIILVVTSGVRDVLGYEEGEVTGKHIEQFLVTGEDHSQSELVEEIRKVRTSVGPAPEWGVRKSRCWMTRKKQSPPDEDIASQSQPGQGNAVEVEVVLYPSSVDDSIHNAEPQTISPANVIYQIRVVQPSLSYSQHPHVQPHIPVSPVSPHLQATSPDSLESEPDVLHPLADDVFEPLDTNRGSSWQYELQQLRFRNDRLKEEIRVMEGELEKASLSSGGVGSRASLSSPSGGSFSARRNSLPNVMSPTTTNPHSRQSSGSQQQQHPYMQYPPADTGAGPTQSHYPVPVPVSIPVSYDARHQGQQSGSSEYPSQQQDWRSMYMPPPAHPHTHPHAQMPVAMNLTLPPRYAQQSQQRYQLPHQPPTPSSLKRAWDAGGNGGGGDT